MALSIPSARPSMRAQGLDVALADTAAVGATHYEADKTCPPLSTLITGPSSAAVLAVS
jgi:hypothetical protein